MYIVELTYSLRVSNYTIFYLVTATSETEAKTKAESFFDLDKFPGMIFQSSDIIPYKEVF